MSATVWLVTLLALGLILTIDLLIAITNRHKVTTMKAAAIWTVFYISLAIAFGLSMEVGATRKHRENSSQVG